ncbi:MAG: hypothetical protein ACLGH4_08020, partial [Actinomycetes bacterium]
TRTGLRTKTVRPRIHDLRHTFAVNTQVRGVASDASFDVTCDRDAVWGLGFGPSGLTVLTGGRHAA